MKNAIFWMLLGVILCTGERVDASDSIIEFMRRRDALAADDMSGHYQLGLWADNRGLRHPAAQMYRRVLELKPDHTAAYDRIVKISDTSRLPEDEARQRELIAQFPGFKLHVSDHYLVVYNSDTAWARKRAELLEKAHDVYYSTYRRAGLRPVPVRQRMVCVLFADHVSYTAYARRVDRHAPTWAAGYYSTSTNRIVFYDERSSPAFVELRETIEAYKVESTRLLEAINAASARRKTGEVIELRAQYEHVNDQLAVYRERYESISRVGNATKTTHEAVHQLSFNSVQQSPRVHYPFWFSEGIATNFEPRDHTEAFGPMRDNVNRRRELTEFASQGLLIPLDRLVRYDKPPTGDEQHIRLMYNQSWALYRFLFEYRRADLQRYVEWMLAEPVGLRSDAQRHAMFVKTFGPIHRIEPKYRAYIKRLAEQTADAR